MPSAVLCQANPEHNGSILGFVYIGLNLNGIDCLMRCASSVLISFTASLGNLVAGTGLGRNCWRGEWKIWWPQGSWLLWQEGKVWDEREVSLMEQVRNVQLPVSFYWVLPVGLTGDGATENVLLWLRTQHLKPANSASSKYVPESLFSPCYSHCSNMYSLKRFHSSERLVTFISNLYTGHIFIRPSPPF